MSPPLNDGLVSNVYGRISSEYQKQEAFAFSCPATRRDVSAFPSEQKVPLNVMLRGNHRTTVEIVLLRWTLFHLCKFPLTAVPRNEISSIEFNFSFLILTMKVPCSLVLGILGMAILRTVIKQKISALDGAAAAVG